MNKGKKLGERKNSRGAPKQNGGKKNQSRDKPRDKPRNKPHDKPQNTGPRTEKQNNIKIKKIEEMGLTELHQLARSKGIPFGGLSKERLIKKIISYTLSR